MKRQIVYYGALPQDTDLLNTSRNAYVGLAKLAAAILGTNTIFHNLAATPGTGLTVSIGPGQVFSLQNIDNAAYGSVAADTAHQILKQGINLDSTVLNVPAPGTAGQSINYLIQAQFQEVDGGATVLPFYNSANPQVALSGSGNNGQASNTIRDNIVALQVKAGTPAPTGSQTTPAADSGWTGLYVVTVANGQTSISAGNISTVAGAPFLTNQLYSFANGLTVGGVSTLKSRVLVNGAADDGSTTLQVAGTSVIRATASATSAHLNLRASDGANSIESKLRFFSTFGGGIADTSARLTASIRAGFNGGSWGKEYLDFYLNSATNDSFSDANQTRLLRLVYGGRVLVGNNATDNGTDALQVNGSASFTSGLTLGSTLSVNGISSLNSRVLINGASDDGSTALAVSGNAAISGNILTVGGSTMTLTNDNGRQGAWAVRFTQTQANQNACIALLPNGTATDSHVRFYNASDTNNVGNLQVGVSGIQGFLTGGVFGAGTQPTNFSFTNLRVLVNTQTDNGTDALQVAGSVYASSNLNVNSTIRATSQTVPSSGAGVEVSWSGTYGQIVAYDRSANAWKTLALQTGPGRVLIGTTTDNGTDALQVNGNISASGELISKGAITQTSADTGEIFKIQDTNIATGENRIVTIGRFGGNAFIRPVVNGILDLINTNGAVNSRFNISAGRFLLNTTTDDGSTTLQVSGSGKFTSTVSIGNATATGHAAAAGQIQSNSLTYAADTGVANAYAVAYAPAITALTDGMMLEFQAKTANTGASTLAVNGLTAYPVVGGAHSALQGGEIIANSKCQVVWSAALTSFVLLESSGGAVQVAQASQSSHAPNLGQTLNKVRTFTANGTFTVPAGVTTIFVSGAGGGAGGGGAGGCPSNASPLASGGGGGGGAGQQAIRTAISVTPGASLSVAIGGGGAGGAGGAAGGNSGTAGGAGSITTLSNGGTTLLTLSGGVSGGASSTPAGSVNISGGGVGGAGGGVMGANGFYLNATNSGGNLSGAGGTGGSTGFGAGGVGGSAVGSTSAGLVGTAGNGYGSGGGGGSGSSQLANGGAVAGGAGGAGAPGILIIEW